MKLQTGFIKNIVFVSLMMLFSMAIAQQSPMASNVDDSMIALQGYSPVSYIDLGIAQRGSKEFKSTYQGIHYFFTSAEQKAIFDANPEKYLPAYGGYCAFGVSVGAKFRIDPNKFLVSNGRLFLFLYNVEVDALQLWRQGDEEQLIKKADGNWKSLKQKS